MAYPAFSLRKHYEKFVGGCGGPENLPHLPMNRISLYPHYSSRRAFVPSYRVCIRGDNPDHHLWNNHGTWFVHYTFYPTVSTKERIRRSLGTKDILIARERRDRFFEELATGTPSNFLDQYVY